MSVQDMTPQEIMSVYGATMRQARRWKENGKIPTNRQPKNTAPPVTIDKEAFLKSEPENSVSHDIPQGELFTVEQAPPDIFPEEKPLDKVFKALGINAKKEEKKDKVYDPKLTKPQQSIFDSFSPIAVALFIFSATWVWTRIDDVDGALLAPDKDIAEKIIHPLVRIYARHSKIAASLDPDTVDASASMAALVGYAWTSLQMYQQVKRSRLDENETQSNNRQRANNSQQSDSTNGHREFSPLQNGHDRSNDRRNVARADSSINGADNGSPGYAGNFNPSNLSEDQRYQYEKLSKLRRLDTESRARRSGRS